MDRNTRRAFLYNRSNVHSADNPNNTVYTALADTRQPQVPEARANAQDANLTTTAPAVVRPQSAKHAASSTPVTAHAAGEPGSAGPATEYPGGARPRTTRPLTPQEDFSATLSLAQAILDSPDELLDDMLLSTIPASPPSLPSEETGDPSGPTQDVKTLPKEGVIDNIERCASNGAGFYTTWKMGNATHYVLLDTGATYTLCPRRLFDDTGLPFNPVGEIRLRLASGQHFMYGDWVGPIEFSIGGQNFSRYIIITETGSEPILGMDFMRAYRTALLINEETLLLNGHPIKLINEDQLARKSKPTPQVVSVRKVRIPPGTCKWVEGKLENSKSYPKPLVCEALGKSDAVAEPTEYRPNEPLHMLIWNTSRRRLLLKPGNKIARTEAVHPLYEYKDHTEQPRSPESSTAAGSPDTSCTPPATRRAAAAATATAGAAAADPEIHKLETQPDTAPAAAAAEDTGRANQNKQTSDTGSAGKGKPNGKPLLTVMDHYYHGEAPEGGWIVDEIPNIKESDEIPVLPEHLQTMFEKGCEILPHRMKILLARLLERYSDVFSKGDYDVGCINDVEHTIDTGDAQPVKVPPRRMKQQFAAIEEEITRKLLENEIIKPSSSEWAAAPVLLRKKTGGYRYAIDYRGLNAVTKNISHYLPKISECLDFLQGKSIFSKLDAAHGYWQIPMSEKDAEKTAFINKFGKFHWTRLPNGLVGASRSYCLMMSQALAGLIYAIIMVYLDDVICPTKTIIEHFIALQLIFERFKDKNLKLKPAKCELFQTMIEVLGRICTGSTVQMSQKDIEAVAEVEPPKTKKKLESFLGLANYHREYMKDFAIYSKPLYKLLEKEIKYRWTELHGKAFEALKKGLTSPPVLGLPRDDLPFIIDVDASNEAIGAEILQANGDQEVAIAYSSASLNKAQTSFCATKRELLSLLYHCRKWRHYLLGKQFTARTDHASLIWLSRFKNCDNMLARWLEELSQYDMVITHRKGKSHGNADALSRLLDQNHTQKDVKLEDLPCYPCEKCKKANEKWATFYREVEDVVPLTAPDHGGPEAAAAQPSTRTGRPDESAATAHATEDRPRRSHEPAGHHPTGLDAIKEARREEEAAEEDFDPQVRMIIRRETQRQQLLTEQQIKEGHLRQTQPPQQGPSQQRNTMEQDRLQLPRGNPQDDENQILASLFEEEDDEVAFEGFSTGEISLPQMVRKMGISPREMATAQKEDRDIGPIYNWLAAAVIPLEKDLKAASPATRHLYLHKGQLKFQDGILFLEKPERPTPLLLLPRQFTQRVLALAHNEEAGGHLGRDKTKQAIARRFYWFGMSGEITRHVLCCHTCQRMKGPRPAPRHEMAEMTSGYVMERNHMDHVGPLPITEHGNQYILTMACAFSKFVWAAAVPDQKAETTANQLLRWFQDYGIPHTLISDQGAAFESQLIQDLCKKLDISKIRTTAWRPQANGQIERQHSTLMAIIRSYCHRYPKTWDKYLSAAVAVMRSSVSRTTGFTPNRIFYGREIATPIDIEFSLAPGERQEVHEYVANLCRNLQELQGCVRDNIQEKIKKQKSNYDIRVLQRQYSPGDPVYLLNRKIVEGVPKKLQPVWIGPVMVMKKYSSFVYKVRIHQRTKVVNHDSLKPCLGKIPKWIQQAQANPGEFTEPKGDAGPYCICKGGVDKRNPENFMINCEYCDKWFHSKCVGITRSQERKITAYQCKNCEGEEEIFRISYNDRYEPSEANGNPSSQME